MNKRRNVFMLLGIMLILSACTWPFLNPSRAPASPLSLVVQVQNPNEALDSVDDRIDYTYTVTNTGNEGMARPVTVTDTIAVVDCPALRTIGNQDTTLDPGESMTCTGSHVITQADLNAGVVTNNATASAAGGAILSAPASITVNLSAPTPTPGKTLGLTKTANPLTYSQVGQTIAYSYVITNTGSLAIGPAQFAITDDHISGPFACGSNTTVLNPGQTISCNANYTITQQDMSVSSVTNTATASGGDAQASAPASATITNSVFTPAVTPGPSNLTPGSTIRHTVVKGEWLIQIARCYGVTYESLRNANLQIPNPALIDPGLNVTVPNIGSAGKIYGPPCVVFPTAAAGDTWNSIATRYNARVDVLQLANPNGLVAGATVRVPINSAGGGAVISITNTPITVVPTFTPTITNTPITFTPTVGTAIPGQGNRITFPTGSTSTEVSGSLAGHETVTYLLNANQGQTLAVSLAAPANEIALRILNPTGILIKPLDGTLTWNGLLTASGDYRIDLVGLTDSTKNYRLTVTLTGP